MLFTRISNLMFYQILLVKERKNVYIGCIYCSENVILCQKVAMQKNCHFKMFMYHISKPQLAHEKSQKYICEEIVTILNAANHNLESEACIGIFVNLL